MNSVLILKNNVVKTEKEIPTELVERIKSLPPEKKDTINLLVKDFLDLPLYGSSGLKAKTRLIDFKYDSR